MLQPNEHAHTQKKARKYSSNDKSIPRDNFNLFEFNDSRIDCKSVAIHIHSKKLNGLFVCSVFICASIHHSPFQNQMKSFQHCNNAKLMMDLKTFSMNQLMLFSAT